MKSRKNKMKLTVTLMAGVILMSAGSTSLVANATTKGTEKYMNNTITVTSQVKSDTRVYGYVSYPVKTSLQLTSTVYVAENTKANGKSTSMNNTTGVGTSFSLSKKYLNAGRKVYKVRTSAKVAGHTFVNKKTGKSFVEDYR